MAGNNLKAKLGHPVQKMAQAKGIEYSITHFDWKSTHNDASCSNASSTEYNGNSKVAETVSWRRGKGRQVPSLLMRLMERLM